LLRRRIAEHLDCPVDELEARGIAIRSAGIAAMPGGKPAHQAVETMNQRGMDISCHSSQPVTEQLVRHADLILTMTAGHRKAIVSQWPDLELRTHVFAANHRDISDPIGQTNEVYAKCAEELDAYTDHWARKIIAMAIRD
jgi:protein-tyrosine phosphatase